MTSVGTPSGSKFIRVGWFNNRTGWQLKQIRVPSTVEESQLWRYTRHLLLGWRDKSEERVQRTREGPLTEAADIGKLNWEDVNVSGVPHRIEPDTFSYRFVVTEQVALEAYHKSKWKRISSPEVKFGATTAGIFLQQVERKYAHSGMTLGKYDREQSRYQHVKTDELLVQDAVYRLYGEFSESRREFAYQL